jgi:hypothetical protein
MDHSPFTEEGAESRARQEPREITWGARDVEDRGQSRVVVCASAGSGPSRATSAIAWDGNTTRAPRGEEGIPYSPMSVRRGGSTQMRLMPATDFRPCGRF